MKNKTISLQIPLFEIYEPEDLMIRLTDIEKNIIKLIINGYTTQEIANIRERSVKTVQTQIVFIYRKLNISTRIELIKTAISSGLVESNQIGVKVIKVINEKQEEKEKTLLPATQQKQVKNQRTKKV